jgi:hypothetical protein
MNKYFQYIRYLWKARNAHGLHSPFVFDLYQNAIRGKDVPFLSVPIRKYEQLLLKVLLYMQMKKIIYIGLDFSGFSEKFGLFFQIHEKKYLTHSMFSHSFPHLDTALYLDELNLKMTEKLDLFKEYKMIIIPHLTKNRPLFDFFCNHPNFTVTIDCYAMGFIFQRPQRKEHFILRY